MSESDMGKTKLISTDQFGVTHQPFASNKTTHMLPYPAMKALPGTHICAADALLELHLFATELRPSKGRLAWRARVISRRDGLDQANGVRVGFRVGFGIRIVGSG